MVLILRGGIQLNLVFFPSPNSFSLIRSESSSENPGTESASPRTGERMVSFLVLSLKVIALRYMKVLESEKI